MSRRIVSLLPAATEIVDALGMMDSVVGVSHECNYPESAQSKPRVTGCAIADAGFSSAEIDRWVSQKLSQGEDLFTLDAAKLRELRPDLILTQRLCDVCAPAYDSVTALAQALPTHPQVLNLEPNTLADVFRDIQRVADALEISAAGVQLIQSLRNRVARVQHGVEGAARIPRVAVIEWLDPVFCSGHWTPELVALAGGQEVLGRQGKDSVRKTWADVRAVEAEILVVACCGQSAARAFHDWERMQERPDVQALPAVQTGDVYFADGNAYFSRPGPRLVDSLEILARVIHPERFVAAYPERGVKRLAAASPSPHR
ncbi:MAG: ABC transporter substrate-binding protein [Gemmataceae bacterium]